MRELPRSNSFFTDGFQTEKKKKKGAARRPTVELLSGLKGNSQQSPELYLGLSGAPAEIYYWSHI